MSAIGFHATDYGMGGWYRREERDAEREEREDARRAEYSNDPSKVLDAVQQYLADASCVGDSTNLDLHIVTFFMDGKADGLHDLLRAEIQRRINLMAEA